MTTKVLNIGMIGLDTSHAEAFTAILNDPGHPYHVPGGKVTSAYPGGSPDVELSWSRVKGFTDTLRDKYGVAIVESPEAAAESSDAVLLESMDGRAHLELFSRIASFGIPVFIDKPFAVSLKDAEAMAELAERNRVPLMSCSALRYAEGLTAALRDDQNGEIFGMDIYGPMALQPSQPGLFWYGIHTVEMLYAAMGTGCIQVTAATNDGHDLIIGEWDDGRIGTVRGNRKGNSQFGALIHRDKGSQFVDVYVDPKPYYASMLEHVMEMFRTAEPDIDLKESLEIVRFIEAANESRETGKPVKL
ncbi:Gfo/Idh/MocA family protein [Paenibacillus lactis]|uniref:Gfo/Idh/MocA family protein n=1 Tax=Paenibacillus lactis TaxID=228574 RepID=UPI002041DFD6|nr:Gfo/Idh/MocA family oxidoreductase [Paenibacillus lactis]